MELDSCGLSDMVIISATPPDSELRETINFASPNSGCPRSDIDVICTEIKLEDDFEPRTSYIEIFHNEEDCSSSFIVPQCTNIPRKLLLKQDVPLPEVRDSANCTFFEVSNSSVLTHVSTCKFRPSKDKLMSYVCELKSKESIGMKCGVSLEYGHFDLESLKVFEEYQLREDVVNESLWFSQNNFCKPNCIQEINMDTIGELKQWLLDLGSDDEVPLQGDISLKTHELADLACERWINDSIINCFVRLMQVNSHQTYIINFAHITDLSHEVEQIMLHFPNQICNGQILFLSHISIHPDCEETFMSQENLQTSHYAFASFLFCDSQVRYADTLGLKMPLEFIEKVNFILSHFDTEPVYHYCHDPKGTVIEDEPRYISHNCTEHCSKIYPLQTCTNICGVALLIGMCIASASREDFVQMCKPDTESSSRFAYLRNISDYSHFLRLVLMQYLVGYSIDLLVISDSRFVFEGKGNGTVSCSPLKCAVGQRNRFRRKNVLDIKYVGDLIQDAVLKYTKSKEKPAMQLQCRIRSTGKLVTKSFPCSVLGQDDKKCVSSIQKFMNTSACRDWLSSYVNEDPSVNDSNIKCEIMTNYDDTRGTLEGFDGSHAFNPLSKFHSDSLIDCIDAEPLKQNRRKNHLDISYVSDLICDAKLKFVRIKGKPALQLGCIIKANGRLITKSFPCSSLGQDDSECVAKIQTFIDSDDCVHWVSSYIKILENKLPGCEDDCRSNKFAIRRNILDIQKVSRLISDAKVRFIKSKGKPCIQLICKVKAGGKLVSKIFPYTKPVQSEAYSVDLVQKFINSSSCETWLYSSISKDLLDISNISHLVDYARLKYFRVKGSPVVQLLCQMKFTKRLLKKTFAFSTSVTGDLGNISEVQKFIDSDGCLSWLNRCKGKNPSQVVHLDISNISDLVDDAKLKYQVIDRRPVMLLVCHLTSNQKSLSKMFPCSSLGYKDTDCIDRIQNFIKSIECEEWLYRHIIKNPSTVSKSDEKLSSDLKDADLIDPCHLPGNRPFDMESSTTIKVELSPGGELIESWIDSDCFRSFDESKVEDSLIHHINPTSTQDLSSPYSECNMKSQDGSVMSKRLDLKNVTSFVEAVTPKVVELNGKVKLCLAFKVQHTLKLLKKYISFSEVTKDSDKVVALAQQFLNSEKCVRWLSSAVGDFHGKGILDIESITDMIDYACLKYLKLKDKDVIYFSCLISSNKSLVKRAFKCTVLKDCIKEIQKFVDSSCCRTWLQIYSKNRDVHSKSSKENLQNVNSPKETFEVNENTDNVHDSSHILCSDLDIEHLSHLVHDVKVELIKVKSKPMHQLVCQLKFTKEAVTKFFPCSPLAQKDIDCLSEIQEFLSTKECVIWLEKCNRMSTPEEGSLENVSELHSQEDFCLESCQNLEGSTVETQDVKPHFVNRGGKGAILCEKLLDVRNIGHLIHSAKLMFVNVKQKPYIQFLCQSKSSDKLVTKSFSCSSCGIADKDCLMRIQKFINSKECLMCLDNCADENSSQDIHNKSEQSARSDIDIIVGKPEINFVRPSTLRIVCRLKNGRTKCKIFKCSSEGKNDREAMKAVHDFLNGDAFDEWLLNGNRVDKEWKFLRYLQTGVETRNFVDSIPFDLNQVFSLNKRENCKIVIHKDQGCINASGRDASSWGVSHRLDDTYSLEEEPLGKGIVAVSLLLSCASRTDECRTDCGVLIRNVNVLGNSLSCCGHILKGYHCSNCYTDTSPQWCRKKDDITLCKNCDVYLRTHGKDRPQSLWKECSTTNFKHLKCKWKLKFVLRTDDMSRWLVYRSIHNHQSHNTVIQERKRPGLVTKDEWGLNKVKEGQHVKKHYNKMPKRTEEPIQLCSSNGHSEFQDSAITLYRTQEDLDQELYQVECPAESNQCIETCGDFVYNAEVLDTDHIDASIVSKKSAEYQCNDNEETSSLHRRKKLKTDVPKEKESAELSRRDKASMVCIKCIQENTQDIFCCSSKHELDDHISECHKEQLFACASCYTENVLVTFHNEVSFKEHMKLHPNKRTM